MSYEVGPLPLTQEWHRLRYYDPDRTRPVVFGASEAAAACGVDPYSTPFDLYLLKRNEASKDFTEQQARRMHLGNMFEPLILDLYEQETQRMIARDVPSILSNEWPWMSATPDGAWLQKPMRFEQAHAPVWEFSTGDILVEAKRSSWRMYDSTGEDETKFGEPGTDQIPVSYLMQVQQQMACTGVDSCHLVRLSDDIDIYRIDRNWDLIQSIAQCEKELAERIVNADPPEPNWEHPSTHALIGSMYGIKKGLTVELSPERAEDIRTIMDANKAIKELEDAKKAAKARVLYEMNDAQIGKVPGSDYEFSRCEIKESRYSAQDAREIALQVGKVKRKGYTKLNTRKAK